MDRKTLLTIAAVLLAFPTVTASGGVSLTADSPEVQATLTPGSAGIVSTSYTLSLDQGMTLALTTQGGGLEYQASWSIDGTKVAETSEQQPADGVDAVFVTAGDHKVRVSWGIPQGQGAGDFSLRIHMVEQQSNPDAGATGSFSGSTALVDLHLYRSATGGGGGNPGAPPGAQEQDPPAAADNMSEEGTDPVDGTPPTTEKQSAEAVPGQGVLDSLARLGKAVAGLRMVDEDGDGRIDGIDDPSGRMVTAHAASQGTVVLVQDILVGDHVLLDLMSDEAFPVSDITDPVVSLVAGAGQAVERAEVHVPAKDGWILVSLPDPAPGQPISSVVRGDGIVVPLDLAWREGGLIYFLDDPDVDYLVHFGGASTDSVEAASGSVLLWPAVGLGVVVAAVVAVLYVRRK